MVMKFAGDKTSGAPMIKLMLFHNEFIFARSFQIQCQLHRYTFKTFVADNNYITKVK